MTTVLVTGSSGFVGRPLVTALVERGDQVVALDVSPPPSGLGPSVRALQGDLRDRATLTKACTGVDTVIHVASRVQTRGHDAEEVFAINVDGTRTLLSVCREQGVKRFVYVSSASVVYDGKDIEGGDERLPYPHSFHAPYAETKAIAEREILAQNGRDGLLTCSIRPHVIFGPGDTRFFPAVAGRARDGKLKAYVGDATKLSDFTYVDNLVDALLLAADALQPGSAVAGQAYFVTNGEPVAFWEFVGRLLDGLGYPRPRFKVPYPIAYSAAAVRERLDALRGIPTAEQSLTRFAIRYLTTHHYFSHAKATRDFGYKPKVDISEGIRRTIAAMNPS
ncbi:MAG: NAD-dependent epimerase/dehydratase family protein [Polyangiaceae bacterium]